MKYAAIDTGTSRNATVLVIGEDRVTPDCPPERPLWAITGLWRRQGTPAKPLDIRGVVGPEVGGILRSHGIGKLAADGIEAPGLRHALEPLGIQLVIQGGELGPSPDGKSIGVYGHGRLVIHEHRLKSYLDEEETDRLIRGICSIQEHYGRVWLPEEGADHHDSTSAVMRLLWHARAGDPSRAPTDPATGAWPGSADASAWDERFPEE